MADLTAETNVVLEAEVAGVIKELHHGAGARVDVGAVVGFIEGA